MAKKRTTDAQWIAARKEWEEGEPLTYADIAAKLGVTRQAVRQRGEREGWQKRLPQPVVSDVVADNEQAKVTEISAQAETRTPTVYVNPKSAPAPTGAPTFTNHADELAWIERQVAERQKALMERQEKELTALRTAIYDALKKVNKTGMGEASRAAETLSRAMARAHEMELEHEAKRTRIELGAFYGAPGPRPCIIVVHQMEGVKIGS